MQRAVAGHIYSHVHIHPHIIPHIFIYSIKISTTQNLVLISSSNEFFIAESNAVEKQKAVWQRARHAGGMARRKGPVIEENGENGGSKPKFSYLLYKTQLHIEVEELNLSWLSLWIMKTRKGQWEQPG